MRDKWNRTPFEVVELYGLSSKLWNVESKILLPVDNITNKVTAVLTSSLCKKHFTCPPSSTNSPQAPPENIRRLTVILDKVRNVLRGIGRGRGRGRWRGCKSVHV